MPAPAALNSQEVTQGLKVLAQQLPAPPAETLAELAAVQPEKREAFEAGAVTWNSWNQTAYVCAGTTTSSAAVPLNAAWGSWNVTYSGTTGNVMMYDASSNVAMASGGTVTITGQPQWLAWNTGYQETEDQRLERERLEAERRAAWEAQRAEALAREAERLAERERATARSLELLRSLLSAEQWASYQGKGWFEVRGKSGRRWRVRDRGQSGNIDLMPEIGEERDATFCAHPPEGLPDADAHAAQMLALVTDDEAFLRVANVHWRRPGAEVPPFMRAAA